MLLNRFEFALMNNPVRAWMERHLDPIHLLKVGGPMHGGRALEIGCGQGVGVQVILSRFGASAVDAFDLDPRMVARAVRRNRSTSQASLWVADCAAIPLRDETYDAVFDFAIIHHVPDWRAALREVARVLKPGGRFYAEEPLARLIMNPLVRRIAVHPEFDRFGSREFREGMEQAGLVPGKWTAPGDIMGWFSAVKRTNPRP